MSDSPYYDINGGPISLIDLVATEPSWAVSEIQRLESENKRLRDELEAVPKWISVENRPPDEGAEVLTISEKYPEDGCNVETYIGRGDFSTTYHPTRWMPLPAPPQESSND